MVGQLDGGKVSTEFAAWWGTHVTLTSKPRVRGSWYLLLFPSVCNVVLSLVRTSRVQETASWWPSLSTAHWNLSAGLACCLSSLLSPGLWVPALLSLLIESVHALVRPHLFSPHPNISMVLFRTLHGSIVFPSVLLRLSPGSLFPSAAALQLFCPLPHVPLTLGFQ